ncbi:MAG: SelB C-terminal domain-containing protein [Candidatus Aminicenantes bacterium]|nr:SelB C-terminal domain-containing protein [Candidatus Aminicenantes bacterium]
MITQKLDAWIDFIPERGNQRFRFVLKKTVVEAVVSPYDLPLKGSGCYAHIGLAKPVEAVWKTRFSLEDKKTGKTSGMGFVLDPGMDKAFTGKEKKRQVFLQGLKGDKKEMLICIVREKGLKGLHKKELEDFTGFSSDRLQELSRKLEAEGRVKVLRFEPLFLLSQDSFDFFCKRIELYLTGLFRKNPNLYGVDPKKIGRRFGAGRIVLNLAIRLLIRKNVILSTDDGLVPAGIQVPLSSQEEEILKKIEGICLKGELRSVSFDELQKQFRLSRQKLNRLLSFLTERNKILQSRDGLIIHSHWLDEVITMVRSSGNKELTVGDFKKMTGLTRKYAIPLLELLDNIGVTRRRGAVREII